MGTNYYAVHKVCHHCGRDERIHICKSLTSFQGHFHEEQWDPETVAYRSDPWLVSWQNWKDFLKSEVEHVVDEYGRTYMVDDFVSQVEATSPEVRRRQHDWMVAHEPARTDRVAEGCDWLDADGFSFYGGGFS
jgi:hypothetical protein